VENFLNHKNIHYPQEEITLPIAQEIVKIIAEKKISYAQACEALDIAKDLTGDLIISVVD
jgi:Asp-tRNA(Asn)/Glu-tRNA(Gln) amidotransferase B subunit